MQVLQPLGIDDILPSSGRNILVLSVLMHLQRISMSTAAYLRELIMVGNLALHTGNMEFSWWLMSRIYRGKANISEFYESFSYSRYSFCS
jgi:hypothetical protein